MFGRKLYISLLAVSLMGIGAAKPVLATDRFVPGMYSTIQSAIDHATSGDRIIVATGIYAENINVIGKSISIRSATDTLDCSIMKIFVDKNSSVVLSGFSLGSAFLDGDEWVTLIGAYGSFSKCRFTGIGIYANAAYLRYVDSCTFVSGASIAGGGYFDSDTETASPLEISRSVFYGPGYAVSTYFAVSVMDCEFRSGARISAEPVSARFLEPRISNCRFSGGAGIDLTDNAEYGFTIDHCSFAGPGQIAIHSRAGEVVGPGANINHCTFSGYQVGLDSYIDVVSNCLFVGNRVGLQVSGYDGYVEACTISGNEYGLVGAGNLYSSIIYGNRIYDLSGDTEYSVTQCIVGKWDTFVWHSIWWSTSNPQFVAPASCGPDGKFGTSDDLLGDLRLLPSSPAIDKGNGSALNTDLLNVPRVVGSRADVGAYEFHQGQVELYQINSKDCPQGTSPTIEVIGNGFKAGCIVSFNGVNHTPTLYSAFRLTFKLSAEDTAIDGSYGVKVVMLDNTTSNELSFRVYPVVLTLISPATVPVNSARSVKLYGGGLYSGATVFFNGIPRTAAMTADGGLSFKITAADTASAGVFNVGVGNAMGIVSNTLPFTVTNYAPSIGAANPPPGFGLEPYEINHGTGDFMLTVYGQRFVSGSVVRWNGSPRPTTYVSGSKLTAVISASDITTAGAVSVTVFNPGPGGGTSNVKTFRIR